MLNISPPNYTYCPFCSTELSAREEEGKPRKYCSSCNWTYYPHVSGAVGAIIVKGNKVLMVKRARDPHKGTWMFPAGFIDFGEHPEDTLKREVHEETGLIVKDCSLIDIQQVDDDPRAMGHFGFFYQVTVEDGELKNDPEENEMVSWIDTDKLPAISWVSHQLVAKKLFG